jgi:hypothetical protein
MLKIVCYEIAKITHRKITLSVILALILISGYVTYYRINYKEEYSFSTKDTYLVYLEFDDLDNAEKLAWLEAENEKFNEAMTSGVFRRLDIDEILTRQVYGQMTEEVKVVTFYQDYLKSIDEQAKRMMNSSIFGQPNTFSYRSIQRTPAAYEHLKGLYVPHDFSDGVLLITNNPLIDAFMFLSLMVLAMHLLISEREEGTLPLVKTTRYGLSKTILAKAITLFVLTFVAVILFYGISLVVVTSEIGLGDINRPIQSLNGYLTSPYKITVFQFLVLFAVMKVLASYAVMCVFFCICVIFRNVIYSVLVGIALLGLEAFLLMTINIHSILSPLARFNLAALIDVSYYFSDYLNMNIFSFPANVVLSGIATAALAIILGIGIATRRFVSEKSTQAVELLKIKIGFDPLVVFGSHVDILRHEAHKLFVLNRALIVFVIFIVFQAWSFTQIRDFVYEDDYYYPVISQRLEGPLSLPKQRFLES